MSTKTVVICDFCKAQLRNWIHIEWRGESRIPAGSLSGDFCSMECIHKLIHQLEREVERES